MAGARDLRARSSQSEVPDEKHKTRGQGRGAEEAANHLWGAGVMGWGLKLQNMMGAGMGIDQRDTGVPMAAGCTAALECLVAIGGVVIVFVNVITTLLLIVVAIVIVINNTIIVITIIIGVTMAATGACQIWCLCNGIIMIVIIANVIIVIIVNISVIVLANIVVMSLSDAKGQVKGRGYGR